MVNDLKQIVQFIGRHPLSKRHPLKSFFRFLRWQISQFLNPKAQTVGFVGNTKLIAEKGLTGITANIYVGLEDFSEMGFLIHFLRPEDLFADIGANAGSYTVLASGYVGSKTIAFEPVPSTFKWLQKNIELNQVEQLVQSNNVGLGSQSGELLFTTKHGTINHVVVASEVRDQSQTVSVEVFPFDSFMEDADSVPRLIKIDVEGFETEVLAGMNQTLASSTLKAIIIELNGSGGRYGYDESLIHDKLIAFSFVPYSYDPFRRELLKLESYGTHNTIYIRDIDFVQHRIATARQTTYFSEVF